MYDIMSPHAADFIDDAEINANFNMPQKMPEIKL